MRNIWTQVQIS